MIRSIEKKKIKYYARLTFQGINYIYTLGTIMYMGSIYHIESVFEQDATLINIPIEIDIKDEYRKEAALQLLERKNIWMVA